ncbi:MAG: hypothetical protein JSV65_05145 [Armatimonadota bacterium]|nr:MAG: hypothetical protein JSV65_05145 [Armatimonadota bacterium]
MRIRPAASFVMQAGDSTPVALLAYNAGGAALSTTLRLSLAGGEVSPDAVSIALEPKAWQVVAARVSLADSADRGELVCEAGESSARIGVIRGIDLTALPWKRTFSAPTASPDPHYAAPGTDDTSWPEIRVPGLWDDTAYAWCRTQVSIPQQWQGHPLRLVMGAVDDNDITYLNGREIGRTTGWNVPREYLVPEDIIRWGEENIVTVMVDNTYAGGGLYKAPIALLVGDVSLPTVPAPRGAAARPQPGSIGNPFPLRRFRVEQGVLRYPEGTEVALWGVNYYPQSWHQFDNMQKLGVDMKATIRADLDHLQRMGVEAIRIHVFDREISDGAGNLVPNEHLDLLDYLVAECSRRGIYMYFTPIAWWGGPNERGDSFSAQTSKPGMMFVPTAKAAAANYLRQFLMHRNTYSGRAYKDEPCLCLLEVQNEPAYFAYGDLSGASYGAQGEPAEVLERDRRILRDLWRAWLDEHGFDDSAVYFPFFRYGLMREYIREMVGAIRSTGATQPVAISYFGVNGDDLVDAIADSQCDAITVSAYPGGWGRVNDGVNLLPQAQPLALDSRLNGKARLAYEFDTPATNTSCYLFPALAAHFRSGEVQVACQFQYDSVATARWNTDWGAHWLNWLYTPSKTVSFMIGGETFRRLPRGVQYEAGAEDLTIGPMATSFRHNISLLATGDAVMHSRAVQDWMPLRFPERPSRIIGVGASPYVEYGGTGLYVLERQGPNVWRLTLNPDARLVGNSLQGSFASPVAELEENRHWFRLKLPGWDGAECYRLSGRKRVPIAAVHGGWLLRPGTYEIRR